MQLRQLEYLVALAQEAHFGRAAERAHVAQPSLSAGIRQLEQELGVRIVERGRRFTGFTREGQLVLEHARRLLAARDALRDDLRELRHGVAGHLRLGVIPTALPVVASITAPLCAAYPEVTMTVLSRTSIEIMRGLAEFELEVGLTYLDNEALHAVRGLPLYREGYVLLTPCAGPFGGRASVTWREAADVPLGLLTPDMQNRRIVDGVFRALGVNPQPVMETNSIVNLCSQVSGGRWSSIVPRQLLDAFGVAKGAMALPLVEPEVSRAVGLVALDRDPMPPLARELFAIARARAGRID